MTIPKEPKIYYIVHLDRLNSILRCGCILCEAEVVRRGLGGTSIGMDKVKSMRRFSTLTSHPNLELGNCVPFYFCPRSVMLYVISKGNHPQLTYCGGQEPIIHLEADLRRAVQWADDERARWAFTASNAAALGSDDYCDLAELVQIDWDAVQARDWRGNGMKKKKQAEFVVERRLPWHLIDRVGVLSPEILATVENSIAHGAHKPRVAIMKEWYYL